MPEQQQVFIIAKERPFDEKSEEQWKQLLTAFAYVLHERRTAQGQGESDGYSDDSGRDAAAEKTSGDGP